MKPTIEEVKKIRKRADAEKLAGELGVEFTKKESLQEIKGEIIDHLTKDSSEGTDQEGDNSDQPTDDKPKETDTTSNEGDSKTDGEEESEEEKEEQESIQVKALVNMTCLDESILVKDKICTIHTEEEYERLKKDRRNLIQDI